MTAEEALAFHKKIEAGVKKAIALEIEMHRRMGRSIVVSSDGKVVKIPAHEIPPYLEAETSDES